MKTNRGNKDNLDGRASGNPPETFVDDFADENEEIFEDLPTKKIVRRKKAWGHLYPEMSRFCTTFMNEVIVVEPDGCSIMPEYARREWEKYLSSRDPAKKDLLHDIIAHDDFVASKNGGVRVNPPYKALSFKCNFCKFETSLLDLRTFDEWMVRGWNIENWQESLKLRTEISNHLFLSHGINPRRRKKYWRE